MHIISLIKHQTTIESPEIMSDAVGYIRIHAYVRVRVFFLINEPRQKKAFTNDRAGPPRVIRGIIQLFTPLLFTVYLLASGTTLIIIARLISSRARKPKNDSCLPFEIVSSFNCAAYNKTHTHAKRKRAAQHVNKRMCV